MAHDNSLPVILVSAKDLKTAEILISQIIGDEMLHSSTNNSNTDNCVWHLKNKYYLVDVQLHPLGDGEPPTSVLLESVEAHIIYITDTEDDVVSQAEKRFLQMNDVDVRLLLYDAAQAPPELEAWARGRRYECVPLLEPRADDAADEPFAETYGLERARAALHAHTWRGLRRLDRPPRAPPRAEDGTTSSDEEWAGPAEEWEGPTDDGEADVERAEAFAAALGALAEARADAGAGADDAARRRRAEAALDAFCRAMGVSLDRL